MISKILTRKNILTTLSVLVYLFVMIRSIWWWYDTMGLIWATLWSHILIVFLLTLSVIERQDNFRTPWFIKTIAVVVGLFCITAFVYGISKGFGILARNIAYWGYAIITRISITNQKKISLWMVSTSWLSLLSVFLSIGYMMIFLSYAKPFDIDCANLKQHTIGLLTQYFPQSSTGNISIMNKISATIDFFKNNTLWQLVGVVGSWWQSVYLSGYSPSLESGTLLSTVEYYKKNLIDDFVANKSIIDQGACDYTLWQIQKIATNSTFQISAIILAVLLMLVFINTLFIICGVIFFVLLCLLYETRVYRISYHKDQCEKIH